ncbi:MAG: ribosome silencing factor [Prevotellaceae bacterium]|nr:ribosome silencing factor [Candidatus Faecinaster equi]
MRLTTKGLLNTLIEAIQEKKGRDIVVTDFSQIDGSMCRYFIICQGGSPAHIQAIANSVSDYTREHTGEKPIGVTGEQNAIWIAIDYGEIMVHIFQPDARFYYDLEHLWEDAKIKKIPNID